MLTSEGPTRETACKKGLSLIRRRHPLRSLTPAPPANMTFTESWSGLLRFTSTTSLRKLCVALQRIPYKTAILKLCPQNSPHLLPVGKLCWDQGCVIDSIFTCTFGSLESSFWTQCYAMGAHGCRVKSFGPNGKGRVVASV